MPAFEPPGLREIVESLKYKPGWSFEFAKSDARGVGQAMALYITSHSVDSFDFSKTVDVRHEFLVPPATYNKSNWIAWIFDRIRSVEDHEAGEFFRVDGVRAFAPHHSNYEDPYRVWFVSDWETADKSAGEE